MSNATEHRQVSRLTGEVEIVLDELAKQVRHTGAEKSSFGLFCIMRWHNSSDYQPVPFLHFAIGELTEACMNKLCILVTRRGIKVFLVLCRGRKNSKH